MTFLITFLIFSPNVLLCVVTGMAVSSAAVYVRRGSDIIGCHMKCPDEEVTLELYRQCGGKESTLIEVYCDHNATKFHDSRLHLDTQSGCWNLTDAQKDDSCVYKVWCYSQPEYLISLTEIHILDPVIISNITSDGSRLGQDMAVIVVFSGEESVVSWELDEKPLPERYRLIDDNKTLIIPGVKRDDAERRFRVRVMNPVSEETQDYRLIDDPIFRKQLETKGSCQPGGDGVYIVLIMFAVVVCTIFACSCLCAILSCICDICCKVISNLAARQHRNSKENGTLTTVTGTVQHMETKSATTV